MRTLATCEATVGIDMGRVRRFPPPDSLLITPAEAARKRRRTSLGTLLKQAAKAGKNEQIAAISGHASLDEVARYTKAADKARLARDAMARMVKAVIR